MELLVDLDMDRSVLIYNVGSTLCWRIKQGEKYGMSKILHDDYKGGLQSCSYHNTVFYVYQNIENRWIVGNVNEGKLYLQMDEVTGTAGLCTLGNELVCIYLGDDEKVHCNYVFRPEKHQILEYDCAYVHQMEQKIEALQNELKRHKFQIDSAITQYNELKSVAEQYRDEAIKWRGKFL